MTPPLTPRNAQFIRMVFASPRKNLVTIPCPRSIPEASLAAEEPQLVVDSDAPVRDPPDLLSLARFPSFPPWM